MDFRIQNAKGDDLEWLREVPPHLRVLSLNGAARFYSNGDFGNIVLQNIHAPDVDMWYCCYFIQKPCVFNWSSPTQMLGLQAMLRNQWNAMVDGLQEGQIKPHQFNLTYLPSINFSVTFEPGTYTSLEMRYPLNALQRYLLLYPSLHGFLEKINGLSAANLFPHHDYLTPEMMEVTHQLLYSEYPSEVLQTYLQIKADELLFLVLSEMRNHRKRNTHALSRENIDRVYEALHWIEKHVDDPSSLHQIAKEVGLNDFQLKKGFRTIFGTSVFEHILKLRLEKARMLLLETEKPIREIAFLTGYSNQSSFTTAFTKHFGFSPMIVRRKRKP